MRPYLRVANVLEDRIDTSDVKFMNFTPSEFNRYHIRSGDILLNEGQSSDLVGRSAIYYEEIEGRCFQKTLLRFRASEEVSPEYAQIVFLHYLRSKRFRRAAPITTNMAHLTLERLLPIEFPLPPRKEQHVIIHRSREMRDTINDMESAVGGRDRAALRQSILKAAFEGRLVPQDPGNVYRHDYDNVAEEIVWRTVQHNLAPLLAAVERELPRFPKNNEGDKKP
jgi:type I restriction enzyme S subunit